MFGQSQMVKITLIVAASGRKMFGLFTTKAKMFPSRSGIQGFK
jgi:hypothetical protein